MIRSFVRRRFSWLQIIWLIIWSPFLLFISNANWWWLLSLPSLWIAAWWARGYPLSRTPLNFSIGLMGGMTLLSLLITPDLALSLPKAAGLFLGFAWFYAVADLSHVSRGVASITGGLIVIGLGISLLGLVGTHWLDKSGLLAAITNRLPEVIRGLPDAAEGFHPNEVAGTLLWVIPFGGTVSMLSFRQRSRWWGTAIGLATMCMLTFLLVSQSRSAWFGLAIAGVVTAIIVGNRAIRWIVFALIAILILLAVLVGPDRIGSALFGGSTPTTIENPSPPTVGTLNWIFRLEIWRTALAGITDFPFTGMGIGTFREVGLLLYPMSVPASYDYAHAHNEFLQVALDIGLPGLIAFIAIYLSAFGMMWKIWRAYPVSTGWSNEIYLTLGLGGGILAHLGYSFTDAVALGAKPSILFWILLGFITGLFQMLHLAPGAAQTR